MLLDGENTLLLCFHEGQSGVYYNNLLGECVKDTLYYLGLVEIHSFTHSTYIKLCVFLSELFLQNHSASYIKKLKGGLFGKIIFGLDGKEGCGGVGKHFWLKFYFINPIGD